jgi:hypothetical protein
MDLAIEANRNSALFNTMQDVLDVYNPLLHKARPTVVNQTKHRIRTPAATWANNLDRWNGSRTARFNMSRIGTLVDASLKIAIQIPGEEPSATQRAQHGDRGYAKRSLTTGGLDNTDADTNTARGRLDRVYADRLLGFNMIRRYVVSSKSREIFSATGEYLLTRFSQMDDTMKEAVMKSITPVDLMAGSCDDIFYAPHTTYQMAIPLFMFFNEHITNGIDVNFAEEVHIDIEFRAPSDLFYYGNLGDLSHVPTQFASSSKQGYYQTTAGDASAGNRGKICWDQSTTIGSTTVNNAGTNASVTIMQSNTQSNAGAGDPNFFGTANVGINELAASNAWTVEVDPTESSAMTQAQMQHIQGIQNPLDGEARKEPTVTTGWVDSATYYKSVGYVHGGTTFAYPDVDNNGDSVLLQAEMNCDFIVQDTDAYRALRAETFPQGSGFTSIVFNTSQEVFSNLMADSSTSRNLLDKRSGGDFTDPAQSTSGIIVGDSTRFVNLDLRDNHLTFATHFMVRKHSDMGGDGTVAASKTVSTYGKTTTVKNLGAHEIYSRCLPVHYFQVLAAGRVVYESDGKTQLALTQSAMYNGTGKDWGTSTSTVANLGGTGVGYDSNRTNARPFNVYTINWGVSASRLENTGCLSLQNLNNPILRIYFKPETWAEHQVELDSAGGSEARSAAALGVQVDVIHEHFNVVTVNSGNGEITSGLNQ